VNLQIFGTKKCSDSRKAERFFKERGIKFQSIDLAQKGMSAGELRGVAARVGGPEQLIDRDGKRYLEKGLKYAAPTGPRIEQILLDDPLLLRTPVVRDGGRATVGYCPEVWQQWIDQTGDGRR
jgi:arsenate reductase-like glutaredoxin family protein